MIVTQVYGNETRVIGSRHWENKPLHGCFNDVLQLFPWRHYHTHVTSPDADLVYAPQFERFGWYCEAAPDIKDTITLARELFSTLKIDNTPRPWTAGNPNNDEFVNALNQHSPSEQKMTDGFNVTPHHNLARYYSRALELYAAWVHAGNAKPSALGPAPNYAIWDRAVI
jgi:hypothetical protein